MRQAWRRLSSGEDQRRGTFRLRASRLLAISSCPRAMRQLIVNACSLSDVAFTLLVSFRGLAVSPRTSFERLTLYHSRVIKQAVILRAVLRSRYDLRCIEQRVFRDGSRRRGQQNVSGTACPVAEKHHVRSFSSAAVSLSRLASAISMAHNAQSTLPFQLVAPTQNADAPAVGCGGRFGGKLSGESCLLVV